MNGGTVGTAGKTSGNALNAWMTAGTSAIVARPVGTACCSSENGDCTSSTVPCAFYSLVKTYHMGANMLGVGAAVASGALFGLDAVTWKKAVTDDNLSNATGVRIGAQAATIGVAWLVATQAFKFKAKPLTGTETAWATGSGVLTGLGVALLGVALTSGGVTSAIVANQSTMLIVTALAAMALFQKKLSGGRWLAIALAGGAIVANAW